MDSAQQLGALRPPGNIQLVSAAGDILYRLCVRGDQGGGGGGAGADTRVDSRSMRRTYTLYSIQSLYPTRIFGTGLEEGGDFIGGGV